MPGSTNLSPRSVPARRFELQASDTLRRLRWALHLLATAAALLNPLPLPLRLALAGAVVAAGFAASAAGRDRPRLETLLVRSDGRWVAVPPDGGEFPVEVLGCSLSSPLLVWLVWQSESGRGRMLILPDNLPPSQFRELRVSLRIAAARALS